jgi:6-phospho-3-hexuloisomerase
LTVAGAHSSDRSFTVPSITSVRPAIVREIDQLLLRVDETQFDQFCRSISGAKRISMYGLGREGLALRGFCMRLMHLGLDAHFAGDITAGPLSGGDLLIVTSGPGNLQMTRAMIDLGHRAGARVVVVTAHRDSPDPAAADEVLIIPAQTMATDGQATSVFPMGTIFEIVMGIVFDIAVLRLTEMLGVDTGSMRARHTNLE